MFITKKHLSRRTFLRGAGVAVGLPLLDAMIPAWTALAQTAAAPKPRMGFIYFPHGAIMDQWTPAAEGADFEMSPILKPLEPFKKQLTIVSGLENKAAIAAARACAQSGNVAERRGAAARARSHTAASPSIRWRPRTSGRTRRCRRSKWPRKAAAARRRLRSQLRLQLRRHDLVPHAVHAAADGSATRASCSSGCSARATRRRSARRSRKQYSSILDLVSRKPPICRRLSARRTARGSATIWKACARSSGACRRWKSGI